jgi:hypothetical protein
MAQKWICVLKMDKFMLKIPYFLRSASNSRIVKIRELVEGLGSGAYENNDYGNLQVINEYLGRQLNKPISTRITHGWAWKYPGQTPYLNNFQHTLVWGEESRQYAHQKGWTNFVDVGAVWLYFLDIMTRNGWTGIEFTPTIDELWVLGAHSNTSTEMNTRQIAEFLAEAARSKVDRKVVLLTFHDYEKAKLGKLLDGIPFPVLTLGPRRITNLANSHYMQLYFLLKNTRLVKTNYPTTLLLYAHTVGCELSFIKDNDFLEALDFAKITEDLGLEHFLSCTFDTDEDLDAYVMGRLGSQSFRSLSEMESLLKFQASNYLLVRLIYSVIQLIRVLLSKLIRHVFL